MRKLVPIALIAAAGLFAVATPSLARQGADDPKGHVRHDGEGAGHPMKPADMVTIARNGADDAPGDVRREDRQQDRRQDRGHGVKNG